jgi:NAD(P)-dependent dehydrogenase (short-subunit alcohol dehydrogenase family)
MKRRDRTPAHVAVVVGASRGLGAALAAALVARGYPRVIGVSRTPPGNEIGSWPRDERYEHVALDVRSPEAPKRLHDVLASPPAGAPLLVVFNAAVVQSDLQPGGTIDFAVFDEVNAVGVTGFGHVLRAVQDPLLTRGGLFVGISSFAALSPPVVEPRLAYAASKAYLDVALRVLRRAWRPRVHVVTVHLGHIGGDDHGVLGRWIRPSYGMAAEWMLRRLAARRVPHEIEYTFAYTLAYRYVLRMLGARAAERVLTRVARRR